MVVARSLSLPVVVIVLVLFLTALTALLVAAHGLDATPRR